MILPHFLILVSLLNLIYILPPKAELQVMLHNPFLSYQQRLRLKLGSPFYEYIQYLNQNIPSTATVAIPPETSQWGFYGNFYYMQNYLYPRPISTELTKADYALYIKNNSVWPSESSPSALLQSNLGFIKL